MHLLKVHTFVLFCFSIKISQRLDVIQLRALNVVSCYKIISRLRGENLK